MCRSQGHTAAGNITSIKSSNDIVGNRTRDLPAGSAVPLTTAPPHFPYIYVNQLHQTIEPQTKRPPTVSYLQLIGTFWKIFLEIIIYCRKIKSIQLGLTESFRLSATLRLNTENMLFHETKNSFPNHTTQSKKSQ